MCTSTRKGDTLHCCSAAEAYLHLWLSFAYKMRCGLPEAAAAVTASLHPCFHRAASPQKAQRAVEIVLSIFFQRRSNSL